jgi:hypothetical protein
MVRAVASVVRAIADEDVVDADRICASSVAVVVKLLTLVILVIWPMVNERPSTMATKSRMMTGDGNGYPKPEYPTGITR